MLPFLNSGNDNSIFALGNDFQIFSKYDIDRGMSKGSSPKCFSKISNLSEIINFYSIWNHQQTVGFLPNLFAYIR